MNNLRLTIALICCFIFFILIPTGEGSLFEFILENDNIFQKCSEIEDNNGIEDLFDFSNFVIEYIDGNVHIDGNTTNVWNINPTDRVEWQTELFKYQRGTWQPTPWTLYVKDFCEQQFTDRTIWYNAWSRYIIPEDRQCINKLGHVYHYESAMQDNTFNMLANVAGYHKLRIKLDAFNEFGVKHPKSICFEIVGDVVKIK